jgi:hypothetical protein
LRQEELFLGGRIILRSPFGRYSGKAGRLRVMTREINITIKNEDLNDTVAMLLEVVAGEIRQGKFFGDEPDCSWKMSPIVKP